MISNMEDAIRWLGSDSQAVPYYLHLLNLQWSPEGQNNDLKRYSALAWQLKDNPSVIQTLIRDRNWRPNLVGNAVAMLLRASEFQGDLIWSLVHGTWVAPQIAVGLAMVAASTEQSDLETLLANASVQSPPKLILSAYAALRFLDNNKANEFEATAIFDKLKARDENRCIEIAGVHWAFWQEITLDPEGELLVGGKPPRPPIMPISPVPTTPRDFPQVEVISVAVDDERVIVYLRLYNTHPKPVRMDPEDLSISLGYVPQPLSPPLPVDGLGSIILMPAQETILTLHWPWTGEPYAMLRVGVYQYALQLE